MEIEYTVKAQADREFWKNSGQIIIQKKISALIEDIKKTPFTGIGKPEELKHNLSGYWSRRITDKHRLVYKVTEKKIYVASLKDHYL